MGSRYFSSHDTFLRALTGTLTLTDVCVCAVKSSQHHSVASSRQAKNIYACIHTSAKVFQVTHKTQKICPDYVNVDQICTSYCSCEIMWRSCVFRCLMHGRCVTLHEQPLWVQASLVVLAWHLQSAACKAVSRDRRPWRYTALSPVKNPKDHPAAFCS